VTFNDHEGSTKSYRSTREKNVEVAHADFVPLRREISAEIVPDAVTSVTMHDGSVVRFSKVAPDYDPTSKQAVSNYLQERQKKGEVPTGLLYLDTSAAEMHEIAGTTEVPLVKLPFEKLCPGNAALEKLQQAFR
jgi:2-oxoglutarate ferredoxin oxidoreductase subunit beta